MKVFLVWSGDRSKAVALALRDWLRHVIQDTDPFMSEDDIEKGTPWEPVLWTQLKTSDYGIACITSENMMSHWVHFEVGALTLHLERKVAPFLLGIDKNALIRPLASFQLTTATDRDDVWKLVQSLNQQRESPLQDPILTKSFEKWWPDLETKLTEILAGTGSMRVVPPADRVLLEELVQLARANDKLLRALAERSPAAEVGTFRPPHRMTGTTGPLIKITAEERNLRSEKADE